MSYKIVVKTGQVWNYNFMTVITLMWQIVSSGEKIDKQLNHSLPHWIYVKSDALLELFTSKPTTRNLNPWLILKHLVSILEKKKKKSKLDSCRR